MQNLIFIGTNRGNRDFKDFIPFSNLTIAIKTGNLPLEIPCYPTFTFYFPFSSHTFPREKNYPKTTKERTPSASHNPVVARGYQNRDE